MENSNTETITFDENGFALSSGFIKTYDVDSNNIYIGSNDTYITEGFGLPAGSYLDAPVLAIEKNEVIVRRMEGWDVVPDFRRQVFYSKQDGSEVEIKEVGAVSDELTDRKYPGQFYNWDGSGWILNDVEKSEAIITANKAEKSRLFNDAVAMIKMYEEAEADNDILPEELELLKNWRTYQRKINRITDLTQEIINWPTRPE